MGFARGAYKYVMFVITLYSMGRVPVRSFGLVNEVMGDSRQHLYTWDEPSDHMQGACMLPPQEDARLLRRRKMRSGGGDRSREGGDAGAHKYCRPSRTLICFGTSPLRPLPHSVLDMPGKQANHILPRRESKAEGGVGGWGGGAEGARGGRSREQGGAYISETWPVLCPNSHAPWTVTPGQLQTGGSLRLQ